MPLVWVIGSKKTSKKKVFRIFDGKVYLFLQFFILATKYIFLIIFVNTVPCIFCSYVQFSGGRGKNCNVFCNFFKKSLLFFIN